MFENFTSRLIQVSGATIHCRVGGNGPPLLLLHGCPQTHVMWHKVAPALSRHFTVVASDLRGYGDSSKPAGLPDHANYSFRAMAADQVEVMSSLGFETFSAVGHDRGARVLHRMALDHPEVLGRVALLDILPTAFLYAHTDRAFATRYWEWFFFVQDYDFPEKLLSGNPEAFLRYELGDLVDNGIVSHDAWNEYLRVLSTEPAIHGMCEDYRAGATADFEIDKADHDRDKKITIPVLALWGEVGIARAAATPLDTWKTWATNVSGGPVDSGHFLTEENPDVTAKALREFFSAG